MTFKTAPQLFRQIRVHSNSFWTNKASPQLPFIDKSGRLYIRVVVRLFGCLFECHGRDSSDVTLAFEDAQVIQTLMDYE